MPAPGIRNNNPGNIRNNPHNHWQGLALVQDDPHGFCKFVDAEHGIRAMAIVLHNYGLDGIDTVEKIIGRWAPAEDHNNVGAYVKDVIDHMGVAFDQILDLSHASILKSLIKAIIHHENGSDPYPDETIAAGVDLAGIAA